MHVTGSSSNTNKWGEFSMKRAIVTTIDTMSKNITDRILYTSVKAR